MSLAKRCLSYSTAFRNSICNRINNHSPVNTILGLNQSIFKFSTKIQYKKDYRSSIPRAFQPKKKSHINFTKPKSSGEKAKIKVARNLEKLGKKGYVEKRINDIKAIHTPENISLSHLSYNFSKLSGEQDNQHELIQRYYKSMIKLLRGRVNIIPLHNIFCGIRNFTNADSKVLEALADATAPYITKLNPYTLTTAQLAIANCITHKSTNITPNIINFIKSLQKETSSKLHIFSKRELIDLTHALLRLPIKDSQLVQEIVPLLPRLSTKAAFRTGTLLARDGFIGGRSDYKLKEIIKRVIFKADHHHSWLGWSRVDLIRNDEDAWKLICKLPRSWVQKALTVSEMDRSIAFSGVLLRNLKKYAIEDFSTKWEPVTFRHDWLHHIPIFTLPDGSNKSYISITNKNNIKVDNITNELINILPQSYISYIYKLEMQDIKIPKKTKDQENVFKHETPKGLYRWFKRNNKTYRVTTSHTHTSRDNYSSFQPNPNSWVPWFKSPEYNLLSKGFRLLHELELYNKFNLPKIDRFDIDYMIKSGSWHLSSAFFIRRLNTQKWDRLSSLQLNSYILEPIESPINQQDLEQIFSLVTNKGMLKINNEPSSNEFTNISNEKLQWKDILIKLNTDKSSNIKINRIKDGASECNDILNALVRVKTVEVNKALEEYENFLYNLRKKRIRYLVRDISKKKLEHILNKRDCLSIERYKKTRALYMNKKFRYKRRISVFQKQKRSKNNQNLIYKNIIKFSTAIDAEINSSFDSSKIASYFNFTVKSSNYQCFPNAILDHFPRMFISMNFKQKIDKSENLYNHDANNNRSSIFNIEYSHILTSKNNIDRIQNIESQEKVQNNKYHKDIRLYLPSEAGIPGEILFHILMIKSLYSLREIDSGSNKQKLLNACNIARKIAEIDNEQKQEYAEILTHTCSSAIQLNFKRFPIIQLLTDARSVLSIGIYQNDGHIGFRIENKIVLVSDDQFNLYLRESNIDSLVPTMILLNPSNLISEEKYINES